MAELSKMSNFDLQKIFTLLPFVLVHILFFFLFIENFSSIFLTSVISLIKNFDINDSDLPEL